jgi:hypothetical protein
MEQKRPDKANSDVCLFFFLGEEEKKGLEEEGLRPRSRVLRMQLMGRNRPTNKVLFELPPIGVGAA